MSRALAVLTACLLGFWARGAAADVDTSVHDLSSSGAVYKVRLAAALALSKSKDPRAVIGLAEGLERDSDATIRRVCALALEKTMDVNTADDAKQLAFAALDEAAKQDDDAKVRDTAAKTAKALAVLRKRKASSTTSSTSSGSKPDVFVNIDKTMDQSQQVSGDAAGRLTTIVKKGVEAKTGYATSWPGGLPSAADLMSSKSRAFIIASTVKKVDIQRNGHQTSIACTVAIRVAPWGGTDSGEKWEANKVASASGSAKAMTGSNDKDIAGGVRDCLEAVAEDVTARQIVPFLKKLAQ